MGKKQKELMCMLDEMLLNLEDINESISSIASSLHVENTNYKPKHEQSDEEKVIEIFNDLINDIENARVTIVKKDN